MPDKINLALSIRERLPEDLVAFIRRAGEAAGREKQRLYLIGGVVRDLLLERRNLDLDLVVEGDAVKLAQELSAGLPAKLTVHTRFGTATIAWSRYRVDFATARAETYARPGALPAVKPGTIVDDLARRDFTINAMAVELGPGRFGELLDPRGGRMDIDKKLVRVLHEKSFVDDATRIWRAVRYEQRLDFRLEPKTSKLLKEGLAWLEAISGDRLRHELECVLKEDLPEKCLRRAGELGLLEKLDPPLRCDDWLMETFVQARERYLPDALPPAELYLALLGYRLTDAEAGKLISSLRLPKSAAQALRETIALRDNIEELSVPGLPPGRVYELLQGYGPIALTAHSLAAGSATAADHIELYLSVLRHVHPALSGDDLIRMGVPRGPRIKEILQALREARLDGRVTTKKEEEEMVRNLGKK
jgi:tRNA nucleotidyltransferase (CCA-adding enzyme)